MDHLYNADFCIITNVVALNTGQQNLQSQLTKLKQLFEAEQFREAQC